MKLYSRASGKTHSVKDLLREFRVWNCFGFSERLMAQINDEILGRKLLMGEFVGNLRDIIL